MRILMRFTGIIMLLLASQVHAADLVAGKDYALVDEKTDTGDRIEVLEFFWYGCPHCYAFEPFVQKWLKDKPDNVEFVRVPAVFRPAWKIHAKAYYAMEILGITDKHHHRIFDAMHNRKNKLKDPESIVALLQKHGVDKDRFMEAYDSFAVENKVRKALAKLKAYDVRGVPAIAVNGKYFISGQMAGSYEKMISTMNQLIEKESK